MLENEKKKLKEQNEKKDEELATLSRAQIQLKNKYKVRHELVYFVEDIEGRIAKIEFLMKEVDNLQDEYIADFIKNAIETLHKSTERLNRFNVNRKDGVINVEYHID